MDALPEASAALLTAYLEPVQRLPGVAAAAVDLGLHLVGPARNPCSDPWEHYGRTFQFASDLAQAVIRPTGSLDGLAAVGG